MKTSTEVDSSASAQATSKDDSAMTGGEEEGEVIETSGAQ
jgi:hypothetical protein